MHALFEIDRIEYFHAVSVLQKCVPDLVYYCSFWICNYIRRMHLQYVRFDEKSRLTGTGSTYDQRIFVPGILRFLRPAVHG